MNEVNQQPGNNIPADGLSHLPDPVRVCPCASVAKTNRNHKKSIRLAVIGDLLLTTKPGAKTPGRGLEALSEEIKNLFKSCDIVLANLECILPSREMVPTEPRVFTTEVQLQTLADAGINVVTMGNNHAFDSGDEGFLKTTALLTKMGIHWFGAGTTSAQAKAPAIIEKNGVRLAIIGLVDKSSGMHQFASNNDSGVVSLDIDKVIKNIQDLRKQADHVIVSPHWGDERFRFPSPQQITQAHALVNAGATLILGHHPHVIQGLEEYQQTPITYSLGNFLANHVYWDNGEVLTWNRFERSGCIILTELDKTGIISIKQIPVFDDGKNINIEKSGWGARCLQKANRYVSQEVTTKQYKRENFRVRTLHPILAHLHWSQLHRIRPNHLKKALHTIFKNTTN